MIETMRHDLAILTTGHPELGEAGEVISIDRVRDVLNAAPPGEIQVSFKCADCGVPVSPVLPLEFKRGRQRTPSPYFSATRTPHQEGCTREPVDRPMEEQRPAGDVPTAWDDPSPRVSAGELAKANPLAGTRPEEHAPGSATGQRRTRLVSDLAHAWLKLSEAERDHTDLKAHWNEGGTYQSAFFDLSSAKEIQAEAQGERVFVGHLKRVASGGRGPSIVLQEKEHSGEELRVWVLPAALQVGLKGAQLQRELDSLAKSPAARVFVLGKFQRKTKDSRSWLSLQLNLPQNIHFEMADKTQKPPKSTYDEHAKEWAMRMRSGNNPAHRYLEKPAMRARLPALEGKRVLCIGCGSGEEVDLLKDAGARNILGIDISGELIRLARERYPDVAFEVRSMHELQAYAPESFDFVYSSLTFHYAAEWKGMLRDIRRLLAPGGTLLFSTHHPVKWGSQVVRSEEMDTFTMGYRRPKGGMPSVEGDYLGARQITDTWFGAMQVQYYHRPLGAMLQELLQSGLRLTAMVEPVPTPAAMTEDPSFWTVHTKIPLFVIFELRKDG